MKIKVYFVIILIVFAFLPVSSIVKMSKYKEQITVEQITTHQFNDEYDLIIVPGQGVSKGALIKETEKNGIDVRKRLAYALILFNEQKKKPKVIVSGYSDLEKVSEQNIESHLMFNFIDQNILELGYDPKEYIIIENKSHQTIENAYYSKRLVPEGTKKILVLATSKAYLRVKMVFMEVFDDYDIIVVSIDEQTKDEKERGEFIRFLTGMFFSIPNDEFKFWMAKSIPVKKTKNMLKELSPSAIFLKS